MCLLTFFPPRVMPDLTALSNGSIFNDDGHGFAIIANGQIVVQRSMDANDLIGRFDAWRVAYPDGPAMFHSRFATHGEMNLDNCHPFAIGGDERTLIAHNGVMPASVQPRKGDHRSDTRITAEDWLPAFGRLTSRRARARFERWMTPHNKAVILTVDPKYQERAYILNKASGIWDGGIWYSNSGYQPFITTRTTLAMDSWTADDYAEWSTGKWSTDSTWSCWSCGFANTADNDSCLACGWCLSCGEQSEDTCVCVTTAIKGGRP